MSMALPMSATSVGTVRVGKNTAAEVCNVGFSTFYDENYPQLVIAFTSAIGDRRLAEDAAQEAMLRACQRWNKIGQYDNPAGWCYRVGMNWATSRWRKRRREISTDEPRSITDSIEGASLVDDELLGALQRLPEDQRQVVVLRIWMDWSVRDTSEALGIPEGTVRSRQARALSKLKGDLTESRDEQDE